LDIAYQVLGDGAIDLVMIPAPLIPIDSIDAEQSLHRFFGTSPRLAGSAVAADRSTGLKA
jgi:hypothetical protein